jgi:signal transduction histidine kinase
MCAGIVYNITELKKMETEMARLDRLNLIGEMAAGIGHEIRNPLTTVRGFLQLLEEKQENDQYRQYYDLMIQELDRANGIITEFLFLAKNKTVEFKKQSLNKIIRTILPLIEADAVSSNQCIQLDLQEVAEISLNENEIRQLILNLVFNGLEAMPPGGTLTIRTFQEGQEVVLAIQDQGEGIKPELLSKVGIPFFTTKDAGTGLGLAVCYSIAARHNASVIGDRADGDNLFCAVRGNKPDIGRQAPSLLSFELN